MKDKRHPPPSVVFFGLLSTPAHPVFAVLGRFPGGRARGIPLTTTHPPDYDYCPDTSLASAFVALRCAPPRKYKKQRQKRQCKFFPF